MHLGAEILLQIAERILIHGVDMIDAAQLLHFEATAPGTAAGAAEEE